jgi:hypothetical protein
MKNKISVLVMLVIALTFALGFSGCGTLTGQEYYEVENETSKAIFKAASSLALGKNDGINCDAFIASMKNQFPDLNLVSDAGGNPIGTPWITFGYHNKMYQVKFTQRITEESRGLGKSKIYFITSIISCKETGYRPKDTTEE